MVTGSYPLLQVGTPLQMADTNTQRSAETYEYQLLLIIVLLPVPTAGRHIDGKPIKINFESVNFTCNNNSMCARSAMELKLFFCSLWLPGCDQCGH